MSKFLRLGGQFVAELNLDEVFFA